MGNELQSRHIFCENLGVPFIHGTVSRERVILTTSGKEPGDATIGKYTMELFGKVWPIPRGWYFCANMCILS